MIAFWSLKSNLDFQDFSKFVGKAKTRSFHLIIFTTNFSFIAQEFKQNTARCSQNGLQRAVLLVIVSYADVLSCWEWFTFPP